jgi:hypothetical protein
LRVNGVLTRARVPGYVVEAQYETNLGDILVTSYDCPFEESNTFVLLDGSHAIVSRVELGVPYDSFLLHEHWPTDASTIGLHYHESTFYTLQVLAPGGLRGRKPRLKLRRCVAWRQDARMSDAHARLRKQLSEIESTLRANGNESAA